MQSPAVAAVGDQIEHEFVPGFVMTVEDTVDCETDSVRSEPHKMFKVKDPDGNTDWLCSYDVRKVG